MTNRERFWKKHSSSTVIESEDTCTSLKQECLLMRARVRGWGFQEKDQYRCYQLSHKSIDTSEVLVGKKENSFDVLLSSRGLRY